MTTQPAAQEALQAGLIDHGAPQVARLGPLRPPSDPHVAIAINAQEAISINGKRID